MKFFRSGIFGFFCAAILFLLAANSFAGYRDDHLVAWVNLGVGDDSLEVTAKIESFANSDRIDAACKIKWTSNDSFLYINSRLPGVTNRLIRKVFFEKDASSFLALSRALRSFRDVDANAREGLDGIIFYAGAPSSQMMSFTTGKGEVKIYPLKLREPDSSPGAANIESAFCALLPSITRRP